MKKILYLYIAVMLLAGLSVVVQAVARNTQAKPVASKTVTETDNTSVNATPDNTPVLTLSNESNGSEEQEAAPKGFSISSTQQVYFAKGNLQKVGNSWQFAEHQYDYFGENQTSDHRDMFSFDDSYPYTCPDGWYCLSIEQWDYMLTQRSVSNNLSNGARYTMATLNLGNSTVKGMIIFPDDYTHPSGTGFVAGTFNGASNYTATVGLEGWVLMEKAGCVFLPAAGYKSIGYTWYGVNDEGCYMSTTPYSSTGGYYDPYFRTSEVGVYETSSQNTWSSVRLVSNNPPDDEAGLTRSGQAAEYDGTRADFLTVAGKLSRYPRLSKAGMPLHYAPMVTTDSVPVSSSTATVYGNIVFNGWYTTLTAQGFQLSTASDFSDATDYPFTSVNDYVECDQPCADNVFSVNIPNLTPGATYYVRAYATNESGTSYGEALNFVIENTGACPGTPTVTDHQGNVYTTVQIGYQCWTRQNMRCTSLPSNPSVELEITNSSSGNLNIPMAYFGRGELDLEKLGYRYNWPAAMDTTFTSTTNDRFEKRRGICPEGWHVPSLDEWNILLDYLKAHGDIYGCGGDSTLTAKALASTTGWSEYSSDCAIGNNPESNNASGFTAYPGTNIDEIRVWTSTSYYHNTSTNPSYAFYLDMSNSSSSPRIENCQKSYGNSVRCVRDTTGLRVPSLTATVDNVTQETASVLSAVTADGGAEITERGICWSTDTLPTIDNYRMVDTTGEDIELGDYISQITTLTPSLTYHVRAYAINFEGVGYSEDVTFTTPSPSNLCEGTPTVTDHEGNVYNTVKIGYQCWTRENMRCTTLPDGTPIGYGGNNVQNRRCGDTLMLYYNDTITTVPLEQRGYFYNWYAVMDTVQSDGPVAEISFEKRRGICPEGWHVPSFAEWDTLSNYMSRQSEYSCRESIGSSMYIAKALASKYGWKAYSSTDSCYVGVNPEKNNASGMTMVPVGYWSDGGMRVDYQTELTEFWSSTLYESQYSSRSYKTYNLRYDRNSWSTGYNSTSGRGEGLSVRCLRDTTGLYVPTVNAHVDTLTSTTVTVSGAVTADGGETVTAYGLCYSPDTVPTVNDAKVVLGSGLESFTSQIVGLVPNTTYYVRAYATNYEGTGYSDVMEITTPAPANACPGTPTVTDHENNVYNTVQIGDQCWMRENMRCVTTPKHPSESLLNNCSGWHCGTYYEPHAFSPFGDDESLKTSYGYLYNWPAAMDTIGTDDITASFENRRGICPEGWHVPSKAEWDTLKAYVSRQADYRCNDNSNYIGQALAAQSSWDSDNGNCCVGYDLTQNNATGFSAVATGYYNYYSSSMTHYNSGKNAYFWSSTHYDGNTTYFSHYYYLSNSSQELRSYYAGSHSSGYSVRCIKNEAGAVEKTNPTVITTGVSEIGSTSVKFTGEVVSDGNATVTQRGFCWGSKVSDLDTNHTHAAYGTGEGVFEATIANFTPGYTYYMRAYAVNSLGITYGEPDTFTLSNDFHVDVLPYVTDFSDSTSWALNDNGNEYNCYWTVGENNGYYAGRSLFVTRDGTTAGTENSSSRTCYLSAEKFLKMPASDSVHVEFDVLAGGYYDYHYMKAFLAPVSYTFTSSNSYFGSSYSTNAVNFQKYMLKNSNCYYLSMTNGKMLHVSVNMPNPAPNDTCKLAFLWNKGSYFNINQPGAIVANVLVSTVSAATDSVMGVTSNSANVFGKVAAFGDETVTERGVCWATHARPTASDNHLTSSVDTFSVNITGLVFNTEYYVRAYAKTSDGITVYGDDILFRTKMAAECYSPVPYNTNFTDGNKWVVNNGDADNYWTMGTPTDGDTSMLYITNDEQFAGQAGYKTSTSHTVVTAEKPLVMPTADSVYVTFDTKIGGESYYDYLKVFLAPESFEIPAYYSSSSPSNSISHYDSSRYAMNFSDYKLYSDQLPYPYIFNRTQGIFVHIICRMANPAPGDTAKLVFLWRNDGSGGAQPGAMISNLTVSVDAPSELDRSCPDAPTVTDEEGNTYGTVLIGSQCWMSENLRSTKRGTYTVQNVIYPNEDASLVATYGLLYQWADAMAGASGSSASPSGVQGLCPDGWHVPSKNEWSEMATAVSNTFGSSHVAKALAHKEGWLSSSSSDNYPAYRPEYNNASGFSWRPAGWNYGETFSSYGSEANCWTTTEYYSSNAYRAKIAYNENSLNYQGTNSKQYGYSLRCVKNPPVVITVPSVNTLDPYYVQENDDYVMYGEVVSDGNATLMERGFCYSTDNQTPTISDSRIYSSSPAVGSFAMGVNGSQLTPGATYYYRAYATNSEGTAYGQTMTFEVAAALVVDSLPYDKGFTDGESWYLNPSNNPANYWMIGVPDGTSSNALFITNDGSTAGYNENTNAEAYAVKVLYLPNVNFVTVEFDLQVGGENKYDTLSAYLSAVENEDPRNEVLGSPSVVIITGISNTTMHVTEKVMNPAPDALAKLVFAWKNDGSYKDNPISAIITNLRVTEASDDFTCGSTLTDTRDGNTYATVQIGNQCWMAENLRTNLMDEYDNPLYYYPNNDDDPDNLKAYGLLYTWNAVMNGEQSNAANPNGVRGICPEGWHVPSPAEWKELIDTTDAQYPNCVASALASNYGWWMYYDETCVPGKDPDDNNASGFAAPSAGYYNSSGNYYGYGNEADFWTTEEQGTSARRIRLSYYSSSVEQEGYSEKAYGYSVRCVMDTEEEEEAFSCGDSIQDNNGNTYATVAIGSQCWMKENLRTMKDPDGSDLDENDFRYPDFDLDNLQTYGLLYSWNAMMNGVQSSTANPSGVQGICPEGWHVPSLAEWNELIDTTNAQYPNCAAKALAENLTIDNTYLWMSAGDLCTPGYDQGNNNATGFSARPAGFYGSEMQFNNFHETAEFWSATQDESDDYSAYYIEIYSSSTDAHGIPFSKNHYRSVRCVREASESGTTVGVPPTVGELIMINDQDVDLLQFIISGSGSSAIENYGFCMSRYDEEPTTEQSFVQYGSTSSFPTYVTHPASYFVNMILNNYTDYQGPVYIRGYATNANGTAYTNVYVINIGQ